MKKNNNIIKLLVLVIVAFAFSSVSKAQEARRVFLNADWQLNLPIKNGFADKFSGWGANLEGGYYLTDNTAIGLFLSYHTNREYIERQTINISESSALTTDQQHSLFQIPFGLSVRYSFYPDRILHPYVALKLGTNYTRISSHMNIFRMTDDSWGFYVSPELGTNLYVDPQNRFAIHLATYYSYSTNKNSLLIYSIDGISNWGLRLGVSF